MKTATKIEVTQEAIVICPHCEVENIFYSNAHPKLFTNGGVVKCDNLFSCHQPFKIPALNKQAVK